MFQICLLYVEVEQMGESVSVVCFRSACSMRRWSRWVSQWVLCVSDMPALCGGGADEWVSECCVFQIRLLYAEVEQMGESVSVVCFRSACSMRRWSRWVSQWVLCVSDPPALCGGGADEWVSECCMFQICLLYAEVEQMSESVSVVCFRSACSMRRWSRWVSQWVLYVSDLPALCRGGADEWVSECCMFQICLLYAEVEQMSESVSVVCFRSACSMQRWSRWVSQWVLCVSDPPALCGGGADEWVSECCMFQIRLLYAEVEQMSESVSVVCFRSACSMQRWSRWVSQWVLYVSDLPALCGGGADEWVSECCMFQICLLYAEVEQMSESVSVVCFRSACSMQRWSRWVSQWVLYVSDLPALCGGGADEWVSECCMFQICLLYAEVEQMSESVSVVCFRSACSMQRWSRWVSQWVLYVSDLPALCGGGADEWVSECCMFQICLLYAEVEQMSESVSVVCFRSACSMRRWSRWVS